VWNEIRKNTGFLVWNCISFQSYVVFSKERNRNQRRPGAPSTSSPSPDARPPTLDLRCQDWRVTLALAPDARPALPGLESHPRPRRPTPDLRCLVWIVALTLALVVGLALAPGAAARRPTCVARSPSPDARRPTPSPDLRCQVLEFSSPSLACPWSRRGHRTSALRASLKPSILRFARFWSRSRPCVSWPIHNPKTRWVRQLKSCYIIIYKY